VAALKRAVLLVALKKAFFVASREAVACSLEKGCLLVALRKAVFGSLFGVF